MPASILAEPRRKQKISIDPQNQTWKKDSEKFGHKLMEKMGWQDGKGLGSKEQGITDNIRLQPNYTARGLGSEPINHDKTWMAHHDDFAQILAQLNKDKPAETNTDAKQVDKFSIESRSKQSKSRIHYHRFTRGKDLSRLCDNRQKSAILGGDVSKEKAADDSSNSNNQADELQASNTIVSKMSMSDYFAAKMKHKLVNKAVVFLLKPFLGLLLIVTKKRRKNWPCLATMKQRFSAKLSVESVRKLASWKKRHGSWIWLPKN
uniref:G-patch domain-containing protein n=1 Tax=Ditylenchus dipsaci TaxID=166011 RepID=A0A915EAI0_9BILA